MPANIHANALEELLRQKGLRIIKGLSEWVISDGHGRQVLYRPNTGMIKVPSSGVKYTSKELRGSPTTIASHIKDLVTGKAAL